ncbi:helix-turn-helix domain-containing protein [Arthrobacter russicus]|uniref:helix-turn-helix domain-containing protein n=1 Tax=Arthrobacter russicus TaxID=172040 RepID=UPI003CFA51D6
MDTPASTRLNGKSNLRQVRETLPRVAPVSGFTHARFRRVSTASFDCVRLVFPRDGSLILDGDTRARSVSVGDVVLAAPGVPIKYQTEGWVTTTTLLLDTDYLIEHLFWQHLDLIPDRDAAREFAAKLYPALIQVLRLGEREVDSLGPILDELVTRTEAGSDTAGYFHIQALLFAVLEAVAPHVRHAPVAVPLLTSRQRASRVASPRWQTFRPVRHEAARVAALMRNDITQPWRLDHLAAHACLSTSQLTRVFKDSFGVTPIVYLSILRVREMARLIRETDLLITVITERVGWRYHNGNATRLFRRYMGVTPIHYRRHGPPNASDGGPGVGVARTLARHRDAPAYGKAATPPVHGAPEGATHEPEPWRPSPVPS